MSTSQDLQQEIILAEAKVNELREKLSQQKNSERLQAITTAKTLIILHQLTATELALVGKKGIASKKTSRIDKGTRVAAKYADPATGKLWSGRGRAPDWLKNYLAAGNAKETYLI